MKISEVIDKLEAIKKINGDLEVKLNDDYAGYVNIDYIVMMSERENCPYFVEISYF